MKQKRTFPNSSRKRWKGEEVVISRGAVPVARLASIGEVKVRRKPGALRGKLKVGPEFAEPPWADELSGWE